MTSDQARIVPVTREFMATAQQLSRRLTFNEATDTILELLYLLDAGEGDQAELVARLEEVSVALAQKVDRAAWTVRDLERLAAMRKAEADKLRNDAKHIEGAADRLKALMLNAMQVAGQQRIDTGRFVVRIQKNPASCEILEEMLVPAKYKEVRTEVHIDRRAIIKAVTKDGEVIPGVVVTQAEGLRIS